MKTILLLLIFIHKQSFSSDFSFLKSSVDISDITYQLFLKKLNIVELHNPLTINKQKYDRFTDWFASEIENLKKENLPVLKFQKRQKELLFFNRYIEYKSGSETRSDFIKSMLSENLTEPETQELFTSMNTLIDKFTQETSDSVVTETIQSAFNFFSESLLELCQSEVENNMLGGTVEEIAGNIVTKVEIILESVTKTPDLNMLSSVALSEYFSDNEEISYLLNTYIEIKKGKLPKKPDVSMLVNAFLALNGLSIPNLITLKTRNITVLLDKKELNHVDINLINREGSNLKMISELLEKGDIENVKSLIRKVKDYIKKNETPDDINHPHIVNARKALNAFKLIKYSHLAPNYIALLEEGKSGEISEKLFNDFNLGDEAGESSKFLLYLSEVRKLTKGSFNLVPVRDNTKSSTALLQSLFNKILNDRSSITFNYETPGKILVFIDGTQYDLSKLFLKAKLSEINISPEQEESYVSLINDQKDNRGRTMIKPSIKNIPNFPTDKDYKSGDPAKDQIPIAYKHAINIWTTNTSYPKMSAILRGDANNLKTLDQDSLKDVILNSILAVKGLNKLPPGPKEPGKKYTYRGEGAMFENGEEAFNSYNQDIYASMVEAHENQTPFKINSFTATAEKEPVPGFTKRSSALIYFESENPLGKRVSHLSSFKGSERELLYPPLENVTVKSYYSTGAGKRDSTGTLPEDARRLYLILKPKEK